MTRIARWKLNVLCFALGLALVANVAQALLARQQRDRLNREIDARLSVAYAAALGEISSIAARPGDEDALIRLDVLRARLEGRLDSLSELGLYRWEVSGDAYDALTAPLDAARQAVLSSDSAKLAYDLDALKEELLRRVDALNIPDTEKASIREAFR